MFDDRSDDDPLAGLGSISSEATAAIAPAGAAAPSPALGSSGAAPRRRPSETPLILLWAVVTLAVGAYVLQRAEHKALHDPVQRAERGEISASSPESLVRPANAAHAMKLVADRLKPGERVDSLRIEVSRLDAETDDRFGHRRDIRVDLAGHVTSESFGSTSTRGVPLRRFDAAAPWRALTTVRTRVPGGRFDYVVMSPHFIGHHIGLSLFLTGDVLPRNKDWVADGRGFDVRRSGEPDATARAEQAKTLRTQRAILLHARQHVRCVQKAHTIQALQRCVG